MNYALDLVSPVRHVATEMERAAPVALSISEMAKTYTHPVSSDIVRVKRNEHLETDREALEWIIAKALAALSRYITNGDGTYTLNRPFDKIYYQRKKLHRVEPPARFIDSFDPMRGEFAGNIRHLSVVREKPGGPSDELRESMQTFGWVPELPAIRDERGVVLVGHRRLKMAEELGIAPVFRDIHVGAGDVADARRFAIAIASNLGGKAMNDSDRRRLSEYLYGEREWTMARIAEALKVSVDTVSRDVRGISDGRKKKERRGRPRNLTDEQEAQIKTMYFEQGKTREEICLALFGEPTAHKGKVSGIIFRESGAREAVQEQIAAEVSHVCVCQICGREDRHA